MPKLYRDAGTVPAHHETPDVAELRRLAEAATPGPWSLTDGDPAMSGQHWTIRRQGVPGIRISGFTYGFNGDAAFIAAANPAAVLALLDERDALRAELAHMTEARDNARVWDEGSDFVTRHPGMSAEYVRAANPYRRTEWNQHDRLDIPTNA